MSLLPTMPERAVRPSEEAYRSSEDNDRRNLLRESSNTIKQHPSLMRRRSADGFDNDGPSRQQLTQWQGHSTALVPDTPQDFRRPSRDQRPPGPGGYGRSTSNDYTVYGDPPISGNDGYGGDYDDPYQRPHRRPGPLTVRDTTEAGSIPPGRYTPSAASHPIKRPMYSQPNRPHWGDNYDPRDDEERATPSKTRKTSVFVVREGGMGHDGTPPPNEVFQLPFAYWMKGALRNHVVAWLGEFVGTSLFLFMALASTVVANYSQEVAGSDTTTSSSTQFNPLVNLYVSLGFSSSLLVNVWVFYRVSGGMFNPAVTLAMVLTNTITVVRGLLLLVAQLTGAILASFLVSVLLPYEFNVRTTLSSSTSVAQGVFIEMLLTAQLVFTILMLAKEKHRSTHLAPIGIGVALFIAEMVGILFTGGSLNPARSFGPCVTTGKFDSTHWIYWVGPALGSILAVAFYRLIKTLEYEMANPGQDRSSDEEANADAEAANMRRREKDMPGM